MKTKPISVLLIVTMLAGIVFCGCDSVFADAKPSENEKLKISVEAEEPLFGMMPSDVKFTVAIGESTVENSCQWTEIKDEAEREFSGTFESLTEYFAYLNFKIPSGFDTDDVDFTLKKGAGKLYEFTCDSESGNAKVKIYFKTKKLIEIDGTIPESETKVSDAVYTVKIDGETVEFVASWNEHGERIRQMKPDETFSSDKVYSLDLSYYVPVGTDFNKLKFIGNMGGGRYNGSGYLEETGEIWSHIKFNPAEMMGICEIEIDVDTPKKGDVPSDIRCNVKCNGEKTAFTIYWSGIAEGAEILDRQGKLAETSGLCATVRIETDSVFSNDNIKVTASENCTVIGKEYVPGDSDRENSYISVVLSFDLQKADEPETTPESETEKDNGHEEPENVPTNGICNHNYKVISSVKATCTEDGNKVYQCTYCGVNYKENIPKTEHSFILKDTVAPTCTEEGAENRVCRYCGTVKSTPISAKSHVFEKTAVAPTCMLGGYTKYVCVNCNYSYTENEVGAKGHSYVESVVRQRNCTESGVIRCTCSACGDTYIREEAATGHSVSAWSHNYNMAYHSGTCTECGETVTEEHAFEYIYIDESTHRRTCKICGISGKEQHNGASCPFCN